ncbi:unnamed protein product [Rotaria sordida]|uniref:Arginine and glutamate-rich protein 1 n=1 Tax=Rotaria sordida TaxID=392033 RepID=A0A813Y5N9_9BILA|nr:unnamed protein product [Rotaria sordida]
MRTLKLVVVKRGTIDMIKICLFFHRTNNFILVLFRFRVVLQRDGSKDRSITSSSKRHRSRSHDREKEKKSKRFHRRSTSQSSNDDREDSLSITNISRKTTINELDDLASRKKAEIDRLAELERERTQLLRQKETRENLIQAEVDRRVKDIVEIRVREELERRKDEIENEVKRRVDVLKRTMEKQMLIEIEKRNHEEIRKLIIKEEEERKKREDLEKILAENERKLTEAKKKLAEEEEKLRTEQLRLMEDRERFERQLGKQHAREQNLILGKNKTRQKISFTLNSVQ